jgi:hypothetical protein
MDLFKPITSLGRGLEYYDRKAVDLMLKLKAHAAG